MPAIQTSFQSTTPDRADPDSVWPLAIRALHWLTALVVLVAVVAVLGHELVEEKSLRKLVMDVHKQAGVLVLLLTGVRVLFRVVSKRPGPALTGWSAKAAAAGHGLIYLILFALPMLGWSLVNARGGAVSLFGAVLPALVARDRDLAETLEQAHETLGWVLIALVVVHVLAAIWHHRFKKDRVLAAMLGVKA
jgi:cytochrome b561